ncbi:MAG: 16S rRNA (uracil(1498)-N(3))-methyltransferase [Candidatus Omnitrophica bacterium]|nr:16S rRNA (uracil(1498)-N(3))-methyltransferase [Candidatus Omnitrophota bacterium]MCM8824903.1 16S rRNA (uracil(1498)-N(3))-methyltransferase [Candidatus Omnitrophota bacterium]
MRRIYLYNHKKIERRVFISGEPAHYLKNVLRMGPGSRFYAFDGSGVEYELRIKKIDRLKIEAEIIEEKIADYRELPVPFELCISLCKKATFESILKKASELGISKIIPFRSSRNISDVEKIFKKDKIQRWRKIAGEGSKIAGRSRTPEICPPCDFSSIVSSTTTGILFWEQSKDYLKKIIPDLLKKINQDRLLRVFIGPEGGFTEDEIELAKENGILVAGLGPRILGVETAAIVALSILMYEIENLR